MYEMETAQFNDSKYKFYRTSVQKLRQPRNTNCWNCTEVVLITHKSQLPRSWLPRYFCHCMP